MNPDIRGTAETYPDYVARRKRNKLRMEHWRRGRLLWDSAQRGTIWKVDEQTYQQSTKISPFSIKGRPGA